MATDHIVKSYDEHITLLTRKILEMGGMVEQQIASRGIKDARTLAAMRKVPRHLFVPPSSSAEAY